jgi:plastocyanin
MANIFKGFLSLVLIIGCSWVVSGCTVSLPGMVSDDQAFSVGDDESDTLREVEVIYTDLGFEPAELEVDANSRVVFVNQSAERVWIKSEQPFYSLQPRFDQGESIKGGGWFSVVFKQPGNWEYQNYLKPEQKGVITVVE